MTEETTESTEESSADVVAGMVSAPEDNADTASTERPENVPEKFWDAESKTVRTDDVLKSYGELEKQFGSFTGSPDDYELSVSDEMVDKFKEAGMEIDAADDPLYEAAVQMAKDTGMNQEGFDKLSNLYLMTQLGEAEAAKEIVSREMEALGDKAGVRISNLKAWGENNLDPEMYQQLVDGTQSAAIVPVLEHLIAQTRNAPIADTNANAAPSITAAEVNKMQFEKDDNGNRRIQTDPEFRAEYKKKLDQLHGGAENRIMVG